MRKGVNASPVPSELYSAAQDGILVSTDGVKDYNELKTLSEINQELRQEDSHLEETKADKADTLEGYGITDAYTKDEVDLLLQETVSNLDLARVATTGDYNDLENTPDLTLKVDKVEGKGLSTNDFTDEDKIAVDSLKETGKYQLLDLLFSDGTVSNVYDASSNKTPIAFCIMTSDRTEDGLARFAAFYRGSSRWGNTGQVYGVSAISSENDAYHDYNGKDHTDEIIKSLYGTIYRQLSAVDFCKTYSPEGYGFGEWYVPAMGEMDLGINVSTDISTRPSRREYDIRNEIYRKYSLNISSIFNDNDEYLSSTYGGITDNKEYFWYYLLTLDDWDPWSDDLWGDDEDNSESNNNSESPRNLIRGVQLPSEPTRAKENWIYFPMGLWERSERLDRDMYFVPFIKVEERVQKGLSTNDYTNKDKTFVESIECVYNALDYLYDDLTVSSELIEGKTPIGICVIPTGLLPDGNARFMALNDLNHTSPITGVHAEDNHTTGDFVSWDSRCSNLLFGTIIIKPTSGTKALKDYNGKENTAIVQDYALKDWDDGDIRVDWRNINISNDDPAYGVPACHWSKMCWDFSPGLTNPGDWYIPAAGEFFQICDIEELNTKIQDAGGSLIISIEYWTSTECDRRSAYRLDLELSDNKLLRSIIISDKDYDTAFRPFIQLPSTNIEKLNLTKVDKKVGVVDYIQEDKDLVNILKSPKYKLFDILYEDGSVGTYSPNNGKNPVAVCINPNNNQGMGVFMAIRLLCINTSRGTEYMALTFTLETARKLVLDFSPGIYNELWRLPTSDELLLVYNNESELESIFNGSELWYPNMIYEQLWTTVTGVIVDLDSGEVSSGAYSDNRCCAHAFISLENTNPYATVQEVSTKENITPIQTVSSGTTLTAVTEKLYKFTYAVSDLTVTLTAPTVTTKVSLYTFRFLTDSTVTNITFNTPANTRLLVPDNLSWDADTEYEVSVMFDGVDYVLSCNKYIVPLINP